MIPSVPFKEAYFLEDALKFRAELKMPLIYVGGLVSRAKIDEVAMSGMNFHCIKSRLTGQIHRLSVSTCHLRQFTGTQTTHKSMCPGNAPSDMLLDYHRSVAAGGIGMTTVAYAAVTQSGLSFDRLLWMRPEIIPGHILSKAAERMVRLRNVSGPKVTGVNNFDSM